MSNEGKSEVVARSSEGKPKVKTKVRATVSAPAPQCGVPPEACIAWKLKRREAGEWADCEVSATADGVVSRAARFPIADFSLATVSRVWGGGVYMAIWLDASGKSIGRGPKFTIEGPARALYEGPAVVQAAAAASPPAGVITTPSGVTIPLPEGKAWHDWAFMQSWMQADRDRERERDREQHQLELERTREFMAAMLQAAKGGGSGDAATRALLAEVRALREEREDDEEEDETPSSALAPVPRGEVAQLLEVLLPWAEKLGMTEMVKEKLRAAAPTIGKMVDGVVKGAGGGA